VPRTADLHKKREKGWRERIQRREPLKKQKVAARSEKFKRERKGPEHKKKGYRLPV